MGLQQLKSGYTANMRYDMSDYNELPEWLQLTAEQAERVTAKPLPEWLQTIKDSLEPRPQDVPEWLQVKAVQSV